MDLRKVRVFMVHQLYDEEVTIEYATRYRVYWHRMTAKGFNIPFTKRYLDKPIITSKKAKDVLKDYEELR
jgi:hypothetical protein